jgi:hypothetical protein
MLELLVIEIRIVTDEFLVHTSQVFPAVTNDFLFHSLDRVAGV